MHATLSLNPSQFEIEERERPESKPTETFVAVRNDPNGSGSGVDRVDQYARIRSIEADSTVVWWR